MSDNRVSVVMGGSIEFYRASAEALTNMFNVQSGACPLERTPLMEQSQNLVDQGRFLNRDMSAARYVAGGFTPEQIQTIDKATTVASYLQVSCGITPGGMKR